MPRKIIITFRIALLAAVLIITYLATTSADYPITERINDKINHLFAFYILAFLLDFSFPHDKFGVSKIIAIMAYGLLVEAIQYFIPEPIFSMYDFAVDIVGLAVYWFSIPALKHLPLLRYRWDIKA